MLKGALVGTTASLVVTGVISYGAQLSITQRKLQFPGKITSVNNCPYNITLSK